MCKLWAIGADRRKNRMQYFLSLYSIWLSCKRPDSG
jgi:hypothetical protein